MSPGKNNVIYFWVPSFTWIVSVLNVMGNIRHYPRFYNRSREQTGDTQYQDM